MRLPIIRRVVLWHSCQCSIDSDEALLKFHRGQLSEDDEEWYRLVPPEARVVLDRKEVQRQSVLFEIVKSEKDYVADLQIIQEVRHRLPWENLAGWYVPRVNHSSPLV